MVISKISLNMRNAILFNKVGNVKQESIVDSLGSLEIPESVLKVVNSKIENDYALIKKALNLLSEYKEMGLTDFNSELSKLLDIKYTVWVGGTEVFDHYVDRETAEQIAKQYTDEGYDDVAIQQVWNKGFKTLVVFLSLFKNSYYKF